MTARAANRYTVVMRFNRLQRGGESGGGSGSGQSATEYTIAVGGTQELSVDEDDNYSYSWTSSDTSKVSISGSGHAVTVKGEAATESPVKVTCTYGFTWINTTKEFSVTVTGFAEPEEESEIGKGVGEKSGTKYTGKAFVNGDEDDEWVELDVYVADGKIAGIFIEAEDGHWLNLLTSIQGSFVGKNATTSEVDAVSSATTLGFRDTIRNAVSAALANMQEETPAEPVLTSGNGSSWTKGSGTGLTFTSDAEFSAFKSVKVDGNTVSESNYNLSSDSTIVELDSDYLETLSTGEETDVPVPNPVTPEDTDNDPTNHEELPSITTKSHTYEIYQIFAGDYTDFDGEDILTNIVWGVNGKDPNNEEAATGHPVDPEIIKALHAVVGEELDRIKLDEIEKYVTIDGNPYETITLKPGDEENSIPLPSGYYLIRDVEDSQTGEHDAYTTYITVVIKDYTIQPKSVIPTVDKQVWDNDDGTNGKGWAETADHNINESFQFALIGTIPQNDHLKDYTNGYVVKFTDTMSAGVTFESIDKVMVNDTEVDASNYELSEISADEEGKSSWTIQMNVKNIMENVIGEESFGTEGISVVVTYNAHLNENAIVHNTSDDGTTADNTNKNSVYMEYSNNPNTDYEDDMGKTQEDHVWVFTYEVDNIKRADSEDGSPLAGAGFTLLRGDTAVKLNKNGTDYVAADQEVEESETVVTEMVTDSTGIFNIKGLDAGTYTLRETTTPPGYNTAEDIEVVITASHEEAATGNAAELNLTGTNMNNTIINQSGAELPSTGGIGTKLF